MLMRCKSRSPGRAPAPAPTLRNATVFEDEESDYLTGNSGRDWFLGNCDSTRRDTVNGRASNETLTDFDA
jgi:hypothetical protein